jgi:DNA mismatch repair protein MSH5
MDPLTSFCISDYHLDGAGLFAGVIKHILNLGSSCPLVFAATHFHEVLNPTMLSPSLPISFVHMTVMITTDNGNILSNDPRASGSQVEETEGRQFIRPGEAVAYLFK